MPPGLIFQIWAGHLGLRSASQCPGIPLDPVTCILSQNHFQQGLPQWSQAGTFSSLPSWTSKSLIQKERVDHATSNGYQLREMDTFYTLHWPSLHLCLSSYCLPSSSVVSILISPRVTISSKGLSLPNFFINWYISSSNPQDKLCVMDTVSSIMQIRKWGSERKLIDFGHTAVEPAFETTPGRLQSHRCWNSFIHR